MNIAAKTYEKQASQILSVLGNPFRLRLILVLGNQEACVCHLEKALKKRQAYISQHLMVLREAGLLETRRDGKYIYYRLASRKILEIIRSAAMAAGIKPSDFPHYEAPKYLEKCECPNCGLDGNGSLKVENSLESVSAS